MSNFLTRDEILVADDIKREEVSVPEWGGTVLVWGLTAGQRDQLEKVILTQRSALRTRNLENFRAKVAMFSLRDEDGTMLFSEADIEALSAKSIAPMERIVEVAQRLSVISAEDKENLTKN